MKIYILPSLKRTRSVRQPLNWKTFLVIMLSLFPIHVYMVEYFHFPNFWRQMFSYFFFFFLIFHFFVKGNVNRLFIPSFMFVLIIIWENILGFLIGSIGQVDQSILTNAFLLSVGFLPMMLFSGLIDKYLLYLALNFGIAVLISLGAIFEKLTGNIIVPDKYQSLNNILSAEGVYRSGSVFGDALTLGPFLAIWFLYGIYLLGISKGNIKQLLVICEIVVLIGVVFSGVRSAYIILVIGSFIYLLPNIVNFRLSLTKIIQIFSFSLVIIGLSIFAASSLDYLPPSVSNFFQIQTNRIINIFNTKNDVGNVGRIDNYSYVITESTSSLKNLAFGVSYGMSTNYNPNVTGSDIKGFSAENQYLKVLFEQGLLGLVIFVSIIIISFWRIKDISYRSLRYCLYAVLTSISLQMMFVPTLNSPILNYTYYVLIGTILGFSKSSNPSTALLDGRFFGADNLIHQNSKNRGLI